MRVSQACDLLQQCAHAERFCEIDVCLKAALLCMWFIFLLVHFLSLHFFFFTSRPFGVLPGMGIMVAALSGVAILTSLADRIDPRVFNCYILNPVDLIFTRICMLLSCSHLRSMRLKLGSGISFNGK